MEPATRTEQPTTVGKVTLRYWASARAAAGTDTDEVEVDGPWSLDRLLDCARERHSGSAKFAQVLGCCAVLVGDRPVTADDPTQVSVPVGATVELLPPFAGG